MREGAGDQEAGPTMLLDERMHRVETLAVARAHLCENTFRTETFRTDTPEPKGT